MKNIPLDDELKEIEALCLEENGPVFATDTGIDGVIMMVPEYFENLLMKMYETREISRGLDDVRNGRVVPLKEAMSILSGEYGF
ncbi:MAG: type II toxin-antitoxin system Phd/YefM family antitoxin [Clostridia bacterium]|nr:type II toxin-antitoxin system Phd/YefM family antitoxin [Clostridia bacterium]